MVPRMKVRSGLVLGFWEPHGWQMWWKMPAGSSHCCNWSQSCLGEVEAWRLETRVAEEDWGPGIRLDIEYMHVCSRLRGSIK